MTNVDMQQSSLVDYDIKNLMSQTRLLASDYRTQTGHALPVTEELARFDAISLLGLIKAAKDEGIDAINTNSNTDGSQLGERRYLIKGRVIFKGGKARQKLGQLSLDLDWNHLLMVIYDADYLPTQIYEVDRQIIEKELSGSTKDKRGSMTVAKYKAIGELVWQTSAD
jgi:hypothetical protein